MTSKPQAKDQAVTPGHNETPSASALARRLASQMEAGALPPNFAQELIAARAAGVDLAAQIDKPGSPRAGCAETTSLLKMLFRRPEALETAAATGEEFALFLKAKRMPAWFGRAAFALAFGETEPERETARQALTLEADAINSGGCPLGWHERNEREMFAKAPAWAQAAREFCEARALWEDAVEQILPLYGLEELRAAGLGWEMLFLAPDGLRAKMLSEAQAQPQLWVDADGRAPLSAACLMRSTALAKEERTELLAALVAAGAPAAGPNEVNPFFTVAARAFDDKPLDEEMCRALRAAGLSPSTPGANGESAVEKARQNIEAMRAVGANQKKAKNGEEKWAQIFHSLESSDLQWELDRTRENAKKTSPENEGQGPGAKKARRM